MLQQLSEAKHLYLKGPLSYLLTDFSFGGFCSTMWLILSGTMPVVSFSVSGVQALLEVVNDLFEEQTDLEKIVRKIMHRAQTLLKCERCSVQLLEDIESPVLFFSLLSRCVYIYLSAHLHRGKPSLPICLTFVLVNTLCLLGALVISSLTLVSGGQVHKVI